MARWVRPRDAAVRITAPGVASESKLAEVWQCRSRNARGDVDGASGCTAPAAPLDALDERLLEEVVVLQRLARPEGDAVQGVLRHVAGHARDLGKQLVDVPQERAAAGHHHALVDDVARQLRRRLLEDLAHRGDELLERQLDGLHDLRGRDRDGPRQAGDQVAAADLHRQLALERERGPDRDLDLLGGSLTDHQVVLLADVRGDRLVDAIAADAEGCRDDDATERDHGHLGGPAADVDHHVPGRPRDRHVGADGRSERLFDQVGLARTGLEGGVLHGPLLDRGDAGRHGDHHRGAGEPDLHPAAHGLVDEEPEHRLGDDVVGDDPVLHRADRVDVPRGAPDHLAGILADGADPAVVIDGDHRGLLDDDALALDVDEDVGRAEIDADIHWDVPGSTSWTRSILAPRSRNFRSMFSYPRRTWCAPPIEEVPSAASAPRMSEAPARRSEISTLAPRSRAGPWTTARWGPFSSILAPIFASSPVHSRRSSKIASWTFESPLACV